MNEIVVVPHTHWDREWYLPFQRFRMGLVRMLDEVLDTMAADPAYRFTMDGQLAAVEDYLEIRPERRDQLAGFVQEGRFAAGPWTILADEFLCSGETLIRNLEYGLRGAGELGGAMEVGYLPDQFGHCAQMPQILALAGLPVACLWRGVPASVERDVFAWEGIDGTVIPTQYMPGGYGNAVALFTGPEEGMGDRLAAFTGVMRPWRAEGPLLAMYGADHSAPAAGITAAGLRLATLGEYLSSPGALDGAGGPAPVVRGELRSHARANILPGVISARVHLKQAMGRAERVVTRYAEPLSALWLGHRPGEPRDEGHGEDGQRSESGRHGHGGRRSESGRDGHGGRRGEGERTAARRLIELAWRGLVACSGHDSITGCGADETAQQVGARVAEAEQIGQAVVDLVSASLAAGARRDQVVVVNPSPFARTALVTADLPAERSGLAAEDGSAVPVQRLAQSPTLLDESAMDDLGALLGRIHERELFGHEIVSWAAGDGVFTVVVGRHASTAYRHADLRADIEAAVAARPGPWLVRTVADPVVTVAAQARVPALGRTVLTSAPASAPVPSSPGAPGGHGVLDNGLLRVAAQDDGTLALTTPSGLTVRGVGRVVDGGDAGDTYNYAPPAGDRLTGTPAWVTVTPVCSGPLVSVMEVARGYRWPVRLTGGARSPEEAEVTVTTRVELRAGEPYARLAVTFDNACRDHRVRWHAPLPRPAAESFAGGQYAVVRRGLSAEGGCGEEPLPTFPASGFVAAGGLAVFPGHVTEYELLPHEAAPPPDAPRAAAPGDSADSGDSGDSGDSAGPGGPGPGTPSGPGGPAGGAGELAVTLLRAVGYLSRNHNAYRDEPAGPQIATPGAQCSGPITTRFAVHLYEGGWDRAALPRLAEEYHLDLLAVPGSAQTAPAARTPEPEVSGPAPRSRPEASGDAPEPWQEARGSRPEPWADTSGAGAESRLEVGGDGVMMGALRERDGALEVRLVAEHPAPTEAVIRGAFTTACLVDTLGRPIGPQRPVQGLLRLPLRPFEIATVHLT
ncbi:alpha-mannosidase [Sphaerisporangium sp. NPDC005288]|uniref:glycoside hydrolase family 38 N-terminal domain-containing protein n=1 Tax=Sphaerisporangium sp. NPDC005288 TaxID=3155114 RepID=UPI0033BCBE28